MSTTAVKKSTDLTKGPVAKSLILFALPLLGSSLVQQLYNTVDLIYVGRACGTNASAAVGASSLLVTCLVGFFGGLAVGASVLVANLLGAGRKREVKGAVQAAVFLSFYGGILLTALGLFLAPHFIAWLRTPAEIVPDAVLYLRVYFLSLVFVVMEFLRLVTRQRRLTTLVTLHHLDIAAKYADHVVVIADNRVYAETTPDEAFTEKMLRDVYEVSAEIYTDTRAGRHIAALGAV